MMGHDKKITLDTLGLLCQLHELIVLCRSGRKELCISPWSSHAGPGRRQAAGILRRANSFEVIPLTSFNEERYFFSRNELLFEIEREFADPLNLLAEVTLSEPAMTEFLDAVPAFDFETEIADSPGLLLN